MNPNVVSGGVSTVNDLGKDETWLQEWLKEQPARLGLGDLNVSDGAPVQDDDGNPAFLASDDDRYFSVDVRLGEMEAARGFAAARQLGPQPRAPSRQEPRRGPGDGALGDRYQTTLERSRSTCRWWSWSCRSGAARTKPSWSRTWRSRAPTWTWPPPPAAAAVKAMATDRPSPTRQMPSPDTTRVAEVSWPTRSTS